MSATLSNGEELAGWLGATLHVSDFRPIPLDERVLVSFASSSMRSVTRNIYRADDVEISHPFHQMGQPISSVSCPACACDTLERDKDLFLPRQLYVVCMRGFP